jgi:hypothetical protein
VSLDSNGDTTMDAALPLVGIAFFIAMLGYVKACERL